MAEKTGFEPAVALTQRMLSKHVPSTTRPSLHVSYQIIALIQAFFKRLVVIYEKYLLWMVIINCWKEI